MMNRIYRLLPPLKIHSWGGFGSQLFTAQLILKVQKRYSGRRIKVLAHTSGVTKRVLEFDFKLLNVETIQVEDYKDKEGESETFSRYNSAKVIRTSKQLLFLLLSWLRLVQTANTDDSFNLVSFWTLALRGHYTRLTFDRALIQSLHQKLFPENLGIDSKKTDVIVHLRLGDLLYLVEKAPIRLQRIEGALKEYGIDSGPPFLLSDSRDEDLTTFLKESNLLKFSKQSNCDPTTTLKFCIEAKHFLGTGAKLSLWAACFRFYVYDKESLLPLELNWASGNGLKANWY